MSSQGILKPFVMKIKPGHEGNMWRTHIVMSTVESKSLPSNLSHEGVTQLCDVTSILKDQGVEMKLKNRHWYNRKEKYLRAKFDVKVILGAADLKFQLLTKDRKVISRDHDAIQVRWEPPKPGSVEYETNETAMYRATD